MALVRVGDGFPRGVLGGLVFADGALWQRGRQRAVPKLPQPRPLEESIIPSAKELAALPVANSSDVGSPSGAEPVVEVEEAILPLGTDR